MSYVVHIWQSPVPRDEDDAWAIIDRLVKEGDGGIIPTPPALDRFIARITARYPNWGDLPPDELDDERTVWTDGQIGASGPLLVLGICSHWVDRVQPIVVQEANRLGLVCYDMQEGRIYGPLKGLGDARPGHGASKRWWQFWK
jgi:hypothetical protein